MFWDKASGLYDFFETVYNARVYKSLGSSVASFVREGDRVLECACGTGAISCELAKKASFLLATDLSDSMLSKAKAKMKGMQNVEFGHADIMHLGFADGSFDCVVAGNVIHLLDDPQSALEELMRVCRPSGKVIIPTYINSEGKKNGLSLIIKVLEFLGARFKRQFDLESYRKFFEDAGYWSVEYSVVEGRMNCAIAVITKL